MESATKKTFLIKKQKLIKKISKTEIAANTCHFLSLGFSPFNVSKRLIDSSEITIE